MAWYPFYARRLSFLAAWKRFRGRVREAISLILLASYFFSYSAWDWSSFTAGTLGAEAKLRADGRAERFARPSSFWSVGSLKSARQAVGFCAKCGELGNMFEVACGSIWDYEPAQFPPAESNRDANKYIYKLM